MDIKHQEDIEHIRSIMERSSRFISLSGLSGIFSGVFALIATGAAHYFFNQNGINYFTGSPVIYTQDLLVKLIWTGILTLIAALSSGIYFTVRKSKKNDLPIWNSLSKRLVISLCIPLFAGGAFCLALFYNAQYAFVGPATLIFYGLALINASKFTFSDIIYLGYCELALGLIAMFCIGWGLLFWALGFGVLHIIYGMIMYKKYR